MRFIVGLFLFLLSHSVFSAGPSDQEILDFINEKLKLSSSHDYSKAEFGNDKCHLTFKNKTDVIDLSKIKLSSLEQYFVVDMNKVSPYWSPEMLADLFYEVEPSNGFDKYQFYFRHKDPAVRFGRAFTELVSRCGGKKELFQAKMQSQARDQTTLRQFAVR
jgi:hypothetical protein